MSLLREWTRRLAGTFRRGRSDADLQEELRSHLEIAAESDRHPGEPALDIARLAVIRHGGVAQAIEAQRDQRGLSWLTDLFRDAQYGGRQLRKNPGFTAVALVSLALGIGLNTAIFSAANAVLFRRLPVKSPNDLVRFTWWRGPDEGMPRLIDTFSAGRQQDGQAFSLRTFERFRDHQESLSDVFAFGPFDDPVATIDGQAEWIDFGLLVSGNYYSALGVTASRGRTIAAEDDQPGAPPVAVISHRFWQARFAGDPAVIGKTLVVNKLPATIIGVAPPDFVGTMSPDGSPDRGDGTADIMLPLVLTASLKNGDELLKPDSWWLRIMGRLEPGATKEQVRLGFERLFQASASEGLSKPNALPHLDVIPGAQRYTKRERQSYAGELILPTAMVGLILASACANVANLLLARGAARRAEIAMRLALGASRGRIVRQLLSESLLLALLGAALGLLMVGWGRDLVQAIGFPTPAGIDLNVLGFTIVLALVTGMVFGIVPALRTTRLNLTVEFQGGSRHPGGSHSRLSRALIIAQVAISFVLLIGTGLLIRTVGNLRTVDVGFESDRLVFIEMDPSAAGYPGAQFGMYYDRVMERLGALPGVASVTFARPGGFVTWGRRATLSIPGQTPASGKDDQIRFKQTGPRFFETFGMPILLGRSFGPDDHATAPQVAIVNEALARKYFGDKSPLGQRIRLNTIDREIVGVVRDVKQDDRAAAEPFANIPYSQGAPDNSGVTVRTVGDPATMLASIFQAAAQVDPNVPRPDVQTATGWREGRFATERRLATLEGILGLLALSLASVGLYGLMSYAVLSRTREIGLRMALGARRTRVLWAILRDSLRLVGVGVVVGAAAAIAATRSIETMLYGLSATDPITYGAVALLLAAVASFACLQPARRAARIDPVVALRSD